MIEHAPESIRNHITRFGGRTQYDEPIWRLVQAESVKRWFGGRLPVWAEGSNMDTSELIRLPKNRGVLQIPRNAAPLGWEMGPHHVLKYPCKGWILERWMPPHVFGDRQAWEGARDKWGDKLLGEFPSRGDYWMLDGPWERIPVISHLEASIASTERDRNNRPQFFEFALKQMLKEQEDQEAEAFEKYEKELAVYCKSEIAPLFKSTSLAAQRVRNGVQASLGVSSHLGAGQQ